MNDPESDIQRLWQGQPPEGGAMTLADIRSKAARLERQTRRWNVATAGLIILVIAVEAWQISIEPGLLERLGDLLTVVALVYVAYRFRGYASAQPLPSGLGLTGSVEFYRQRLAQQRDVQAHPWGYLAMFVPGVGLSLFGDALDRSQSQNAAIGIFAVALFMTIAWVHKRSARQLQHEIDELG